MLNVLGKFLSRLGLRWIQESKKVDFYLHKLNLDKDFSNIYIYIYSRCKSTGAMGFFFPYLSKCFLSFIFFLLPPMG